MLLPFPSYLPSFFWVPGLEADRASKGSPSRCSYYHRHCCLLFTLILHIIFPLHLPVQISGLQGGYLYLHRQVFHLQSSHLHLQIHIQVCHLVQSVYLLYSTIDNLGSLLFNQRVQEQHVTDTIPVYLLVEADQGQHLLVRGR